MQTTQKTIKGPDGKQYAAGTRFVRIDGFLHAISPRNNVGGVGGVDRF